MTFSLGSLLITFSMYYEMQGTGVSGFPRIDFEHLGQIFVRNDLTSEKMRY